MKFQVSENIFFQSKINFFIALMNTTVEFSLMASPLMKILLLVFIWKREGSTGMDMWNSNGAVKTAFDIKIVGKRGPGRPKMTWKQLTERECRECKLSAIDPQDRDTWRSGVRSTMRAASQLPARGPTVVDIAHVPAC